MSPDEATDRMWEILKVAVGDEEVGHSQADELLCEILEGLGYSEAVAVFRDMPKWYA